nr:pseudaminic acid cytidylyltransferase [Aurantimonas sp. VKM B-3413]
MCLIPARGGSKRIPRKNIRSFAGRPIIAHSIAAALNCPVIDRVIVSTDDDEIAEVARAAGAEVPFRRPAALSDDHATTMDVVKHALEWAESDDERGSAEALCCFYATAPFVTAGDLQAGFERLCESGADYVFSATDYAFPIQRALRLEGGRVAMFQPEHFNTRSQDLEPAYHDAGQFYWMRSAAIRAGKPIFGPDAALYLMERERVLDIDTEADWRFAERLFSLREAEGTAQ